METDPAKLRRAADYRNARKTLALAGTWSVLFGGISIAAGCLWMPVDWVLTVLGAILFGTGILNIQAPRPTGILLDAGTLLLVGAYNLIGAILAVMDELPPSPGRALLGVLQVVWGVQRLRNLKPFANAFLERPADSQGSEIEQTLWAIRRALAGGPSGVIEFSAGGAKRAWKAKLTGDHAVFAAVATADFMVATRAEVVLTPRSNAQRGGALEADLAVGTTRLKITIESESLRLLEQWKSAAPGARPAAA